MVLAWLGIAFGVALMALSGRRLVRWFRLHDQLVEVTGVVIPPGEGRLSPAELTEARRAGSKGFAVFVAPRHALVHTGVHPRAARFRFTTRDGQVLESMSTFNSIPRPPAPGTELKIVYDPSDPQGSAERADVWRFVSLAQPLLFAFGAITVLLYALFL